MSGTSDRLAEIQRRLDAATPGPWRWEDGWDYVDKKRRRFPIAETCHPNAYHNAAFLAHAPTDLAYLLARLRAAEALIDHDPRHSADCLLSRWEGGEPTDDGGYRVKYAGQWYQVKPKNQLPPCVCGFADALTAWQQAVERVK